MLRRYDDLREIKIEIEKYISQLQGNSKIKDAHIIKGIAKYILFLKRIQKSKAYGHYGSCFIYDMLMLMHSLTQNSERDFYTTYRSAIENFVRCFLEIEDNDETGVRNLFSNLRVLCINGESEEIITYIEGEYGKCCNFVHSNIKANMEIYEYYADILKQNELSKEKTDRLINCVMTFVKKITELMIENKILWVDETFYKDKQTLKFLIGNQMYSRFEEKVS